MSVLVELSKEKLDLIEMEEILISLKNEIEERIRVLKKGIEEIDEGKSMLHGKGILPSEIQKIMKEGVNFI